MSEACRRQDAHNKRRTNGFQKALLAFWEAHVFRKHYGMYWQPLFCVTLYLPPRTREKWEAFESNAAVQFGWRFSIEHEVVRSNKGLGSSFSIESKRQKASGFLYNEKVDEPWLPVSSLLIWPPSGFLVHPSIVPHFPFLVQRSRLELALTHMKLLCSRTTIRDYCICGICVIWALFIIGITHVQCDFSAFM